MPSFLGSDVFEISGIAIKSDAYLMIRFLGTRLFGCPGVKWWQIHGSEVWRESGSERCGVAAFDIGNVTCVLSREFV